jgi:hypothetical protein
LPAKPARELSFWVKAPVSEKLTIRLVDGSDQCHQIGLRLKKTDDWQEIRFPFKEFFRLMKEGRSLDSVVQYEKWGGAGDSQWHEPGKLLAILIGAQNFPGTKKGSVWLSGAALTPDTPSVRVARTFRWDDLLQAGELDWSLSLGQEFPGAQGKMELARDFPQKGSHSLHLSADFTGGGAYIAAVRSLKDLDVDQVRAIHWKMNSESARAFSVRLVDSTGQCHQKGGLSFEPDGRWHEVTLRPQDFSGVEHWGGANDGKWHGTPTDIAILLFPASSPATKRCDVLLTEFSAEAEVEAKPLGAAYSEGFEGAEPLPAGWRAAGAVSTVRGGAWKGERALRLERSLDRVRDETRAWGASFPAARGLWRITGASKAELRSPDNSYSGTVRLEALDSGGAVLERFEIRTTYGTQDWQPFERAVELPERTARARFTVELEKTYGTLTLDELQAAPLASEQKKVDRIVISTGALGNLLLPEDPRKASVRVEGPKPLRDSELVLRSTVRDYWGAEQAPPVLSPLSRQGRSGGRFAYAAQIDLGSVPMEVGRYYELWVDVLTEGSTQSEVSGLAVLPVAPSKSAPAEKVPFTIRNWDSRIPDYFYLADRLGLRQIGLWAGWDEKGSSKPYLPGVETVRKLGARWVAGLEPVGRVEGEGWKGVSEEGLRRGVKAWIQEFGSEGRMMICLGNEPHGGRDKVKENVRAYKAVYEAAKQADPSIFIVGTSVEPNRDYFEEGYYRYLDAYDFHVYESYPDIRKAIREYRALMKEFKAEKPILSTELGLNSQGQTRYAVACDLIKKTVSLFAEGGLSASWFTIQYPDPEGKARGQAGDAHCVFDCKYSQYNPRLDAVTLYTVVSGIGAKTFMSEKQYPGGLQAYLFRDARGKTLVVLWKDGARQEAALGLGGVTEVELVRIDGSRAKLAPREGTLSLAVSPEPLLLFFDGASPRLPESLQESKLALASEPRGGRFRVRADSVRLLVPPGWSAQVQPASPGVFDCAVKAPVETMAREGRIVIQGAGPSGAAWGEIVLNLPTR